MATFFAFVFGIAIAGWMFSYRGKSKGILDGLFTLPSVLPPTVVGFLLLLLFGRNSPIGQFFIQVGFPIIFSWPAAVIAATVVAFPLVYKTVLGAFEQVDRDLISCARTLGASGDRIFLQILLPLAWPGVVAGTILAFARSLGEFGATLMLAGSIPGKTQTIPIAIFFAAEAGKMRQAALWTLIVVGIALGAIAAINAWSRSQPYSQSRIVNACSIAINRWLTRISRWLLKLHPRRRPPTPKIHPKDFSTDFSSTAHPSLPHLSVNLHKTFPDFNLNANFTTTRKPLGILGASGSGKSMTLRCIAGLETPTQGQIILNGKVLFDSDQNINIPSHQRRIGFVFQNYALFPHMKVAQNIGFALHELSRTERKQRVGRYIELMHLQGLEKRYPHELSGGQRQRVALARCLAIEPEALLLDEPLSALDTYLRSQIERLLAEVFASYPGTILFVTHKLEEAYRLCDNLLVLSQGNAIAFGPKAAIFEHPPNFTVAQLTECKNFSRAQPASPNQIKALDWGCTLQVLEAIPTPLTYVGVRAHHLTFLPEPNPELESESESESGPESEPEPKGENVFPCWLANTSETQHQMSLYLKLHAPASNPQDYHLQAEIFKEKWEELKQRAFPWHVQLKPQRLILLER